MQSFSFFKTMCMTDWCNGNLKPAFANGDYFHPIPLKISCTHHYFYLLWIFPLSLLMFLINLAGLTWFSTAEFPEKSISAFRSEWVCFLIRSKWPIKSFSKLYQTRLITFLLSTFCVKKKKKCSLIYFYFLRATSFILVFILIK